jgi:hypothetical protein
MRRRERRAYGAGIAFEIFDGSGLGTETSPLVEGGMFEVNASANEDVPDTAILGIISSSDTALATRTLALGKDLTMVGFVPLLDPSVTVPRML